MKKLRLIALVLVVLMVGALSLVQAQEDDNACYAGGALDGRCESAWDWICGYYLQQWEAAGGWNGNYAFPDWCDPDSLLPLRPEVPPGDPVSLISCYHDGTNSFYYNGLSPSPIEWYGGVTDCSGTPSNIYLSYDATYVFEAANVDESIVICYSLVPPSPTPIGSITYPFALHGYNSPANPWGCSWMVL